MKKQYNSWEDHMGQRLQRLEGAPSFDAWERIEAELDEKPRRNWLLIAAVFALFAMPASFYLLHPNTSSSSSGQGFGGSAETANEGIAAGSAEHPAITSPEGLTEGLAEQRAAGLAAEAQESSSKAGSHVASSSSTSPQPESQGSQAGGHQAAENSTAVAAATNRHSSPTEGYATTAPHQPAVTGQIGSANEANTPPQAASTSLGTTSNSGYIESTSALAGVSSSSLAAATQNPTTAQPHPRNRLTASEGSLSTTALATEQQLPLLVAKAPAGFALHYSLELPRLQRHYQYMPNAQMASRQKKKETGSSLWTELMPTWSYRRVEPNPSDAVVITSMESQPTLSSSRFGAQAAMGVSLPVQKNLAWKTGAFYGIQQQQWSYTYRNAQADSYMSSQTEAGNFALVPQYTPRTEEINQTLHNVGITTGFSFQLPTRFAENNVDARVLTFYNSTQKLNSFVSLGYAIGIPLSETMGLHLGPNVQFHVHSSEEVSPHFQEKPFVFGIQLGASFDK